MNDTLNLKFTDDWFTEGFDWPEFIAARTNLAHLKSTSTSASPSRWTPSLAG